MESFSTRGLPAPRKVAYWNALSSETFSAMEIRPRNAATFDGELHREPLGPLTLMDVRSDAVRIRHTRRHARGQDTPSYLLLTPLRGRFELQIAQRAAVTVEVGSFCLLDHAVPYELQHGDAVRVLCIDIPRHTLDAHLAQPGLAVGRLMHPGNPVSRLLASMLREVGGSLQPDTPARFTPAVAQGLLHFVTAAYTQPGEPSSLPTRRQQLLASIDSRLAESGLSPGDIAREHGISTRRLRALLATGDESFRAYLLRRRLEHCARLLRDPARAGQSITQLAFLCGFNNATHFGFAFKKQHGMTPREFRTAACA